MWRRIKKALSVIALCILAVGAIIYYKASPAINALSVLERPAVTYPENLAPTLQPISKDSAQCVAEEWNTVRLLRLYTAIKAAIVENHTVPLSPRTVHVIETVHDVVCRAQAFKTHMTFSKLVSACGEDASNVLRLQDCWMRLASVYSEKESLNSSGITVLLLAGVKTFSGNTKEVKEQPLHDKKVFAAKWGIFLAESVLKRSTPKDLYKFPCSDADCTKEMDLLVIEDGKAAEKLAFNSLRGVEKQLQSLSAPASGINRSIAEASDIENLRTRFEHLKRQWNFKSSAVDDSKKSASPDVKPHTND